MGSNESLLNIFKITRQLERYCIPISAMDAFKPEMGRPIIMNFYQQNSAMGNLFIVTHFWKLGFSKLPCWIWPVTGTFLRRRTSAEVEQKAKKKKSRIRWKTKNALSQESCERGPLYQFHKNWYIFDVFLLL